MCLLLLFLVTGCVLQWRNSTQNHLLLIIICITSPLTYLTPFQVCSATLSHCGLLRVSSPCRLLAAVLLSNARSLVAQRQWSYTADTDLQCVPQQKYCTSGITTAIDRSMSRTVYQNVISVEQEEGLGARVRRSIGRPEVYYISYYLHSDKHGILH